MNQAAKSSGLIPKFFLGRIVVTERAKNNISPERIVPALCRHSAGDWEDHEKNANELGILYQNRIVTQHLDSIGNVFYIITNADRSETVIMLPDEY